MINLAGKIRGVQRFLQDAIVRWTSVPSLKRRAEYFVSLFENKLPANSRILDIGGGWGFYAGPLMERGHSVTIMDTANPGYQRAPVVICEPGKSFPFPDKSFDVSLMITMLHHTNDPEAIIREAKRVTRRTLIVIEDVYNHAPGRLWTILRDQIYNFEYFGHPMKFKKSAEWKTLFEKTGLRLVQEKEVHTWLSGMKILNAVFVLDIA